MTVLEAPSSIDANANQIFLNTLEMLLDESQAAQFLHVSRRTLQTWRLRGVVAGLGS